jgi:hypothetical protein
VVIDDFDMRRSSLFPDEAYPPLVIDADRVLPLPISSHRFKPIARGHTQIAVYAGLIQKDEASSARRSEGLAAISGCAARTRSILPGDRRSSES